MNVVVFFTSLVVIAASDLDSLSLTEEHLSFHVSNYPVLAEGCDATNCRQYDVVREALEKKKCWGYEFDCSEKFGFSRPECPGDHKGWVRSKEDQIETFFRQADFGYVGERLREMAVICEPSYREDSSLECSKHLRFCRGRNVRVDFTGLVNRTEPIRYKMDVLAEGQVSGKCKLNRKRLLDECDQISPLQSWGPELRFFTETNASFAPTNLKARDECDVFVERPTFLLKIDAAINMYHHFCDFFNLYASQHLNSSHPETFSTDVHILIWETYRYRSNFKETFDVFTRHPLWDLNTFRGKRVCFSNLVFPLLPRMIFGLYYNTPIVWGCQSSGLFRAFADHVLHRLGVVERPPSDGKIRVTFLSRESTYRNVLNENELLSSLKWIDDLVVQRNFLPLSEQVVYNNQVPFRAQLETTRNTDVLIGIHGAGLTHLLFLPDWAAVFELYNCQDEACYSDLARLRGLKYVTWEDPLKVFPQDEGHHPEGGAHAKFTNYKFDSAEFVRLVRLAAEHVARHPKFQRQRSPVKEEL